MYKILHNYGDHQCCMQKLPGKRKPCENKKIDSARVLNGGGKLVNLTSFYGLLSALQSLYCYSNSFFRLKNCRNSQCKRNHGQNKELRKLILDLIVLQHLLSSRRILLNLKATSYYSTELRFFKTNYVG